MKIAVWHNLPSGGGKRALYNHIRGLVERGHTVEIWRPPTADNAYLPLSRFGKEHVCPLYWPDQPSRAETWQIRLAAKRAAHSLNEHCKLCAAEIARGGFDIVFANSCRFSASPPLASHLPIPAILYLQEPYRTLYEEWLRPQERPEDFESSGVIIRLRKQFGLLKMLRNEDFQRTTERRSAAAFQRLLVNSQFSREALLRVYGLDSDVCYLGVDTELFRDRGLPRRDFVIGLGSFQAAKGVELVIRALAAMPLPRPELVWIGNMANISFQNEMVNLASKLAVTFKARINVDDDALVDILNRASAMVYAPRLEPFGLAPLEAIACGVPVIAVAEGGVRETIIDGVTGLIAEGNARAIAAALTRLRSDPAMARELARAGQRAVQNDWSLEAANDRLERKLLEYASA